MDKIIFMIINIKDCNEIHIIQSMTHKTGQDFTSILRTQLDSRLQIYYNSVR